MTRYHYYEADNINVCVSSFAGKRVRGVAKCLPGDTYDKETGQTLAKLRCDLKVAEKRHTRAVEKEFETRKALFAAEKAHNDKMNYLYDATQEVEQAKKDLDKFIKKLHK